MTGNQNQDPIRDLMDAVKKRPVESLIAYDILVSDAKKKEINEKAVGWGVVFVMAVFILPLLIAPALEPLVVSEELKAKAAGEGAKTVAEIRAASRRYDRHIVLVRIGLWLVAILSWIAFYLLNASYRGYR